MSPARRDAILLGLCGAAVITLGIIFNLAEICSKLAARYESWQLDEVWVAVVVLGLASLVYCGFRLRELRKAREALACLAVRDDLTGIGNRRRFFAELREGLSTLQRDERCIVALLDLNNFKLINDFYGHRVGDEVLREIAHRLKGLVGNTGSVARIGGDEFGVLVPAATRREPPSEFAQRVLALFDQPIKLASLSLDVKTSVGIATHAGALLKSDALAAQDGSSAETVLRQADMALYQAKRQGTRYCLFNAEMDERLRHKIELESDFGSALANGEIVPYYQPIVNLRSGAIVGCEALARWHHPLYGTLSAPTVIGTAEATGNIRALSYRILHQAIRDARSWNESIGLSVNVPPSMFANSQLPQELLAILEEHRFSPARLALEVTETSLIERPEETGAIINAVRRLGANVALDDFGSGYAGLSYLRTFMFDTVKFDRSIVSEIESNPKSRRLVKHLVSYCRFAGIKTTAEGIETAELEWLAKHSRFSFGQGYLYSHPLPAGRIASYLMRHDRYAPLPAIDTVQSKIA